MHPTGWSLPLIENLLHETVVSRRVIGGVIAASALRHDDRQNSIAQWSCRKREAA
jgi:hypothetical protein